MNLLYFDKFLFTYGMYRNIATVHVNNDKHIDTNTPLCRFMQKQHLGLSCAIILYAIFNELMNQHYFNLLYLNQI